MKGIKGKYTLPFRLTNRKDTKYSLYYSAQQQGPDTFARLSVTDKGWRSHFVYDDRTKSLRLHKDRNIALSNENGNKLKSGKIVVFRKWKATSD